MEHYFSRLQNAIRLYWEKPAVGNYKGETFSYGQLATQIERFHIFFEACGIKKGERIAICAKNTARMAVSFLSVNTYETVVVPILSDFTPDSVNHLVDHSESVILFTDNDIWAKLDISKMPLLRAVVSVNDFTLLYAAEESISKAFASVPELFSAKYPMGFTGENVNYNTENWDDLDIINYTSGTTSAPKGVMLTYKAISATIDFGQRYIPSSDKFTMVSMLPMAHMYGLVYEFLYPLCNGTSITFLGKTPSPSLLLSAMHDVRPYLLITVPLVMEKVYKSALKPVLDKPVMKVLTKIPGIKSLIFKKIREKLLTALGGNLQMIIMGGAPLNPEVEKWFKKIGLPYTVGYGMTEASSAATAAAGRNNKPGSVGLPLVSTLVSTFEPGTDTELPIGQRGELCISGPGVMKGYYNKPAETAAILRTHADGRVWVHTGDIGYLDEDGFVYLDSRIKRLIIRHDGFKVFPSMIENVVSQHPAVHQCSVVGCADKDHVQGRLPFVYLVLDPAVPAAKRKQIIKELRQLCIEELPEYVQPVGYKIIPEMPLTLAAKFDYRKLEEEITPRDY